MLGTPAFRMGIAACVAFAGVAAVLPIAARADNDNAAAQTHYSTTITTVYGSQYPIAGHLDLETSSGGTLRGYYHNAFQKAFIQVVGGRDGNYIWFDIGPSAVDLGLGVGTGRLHVVGTVNGDGSFRGQAFPQNGMTMSSSLDQPAANDQYIFAATPVERSAEDYPGVSATTPPGG